MKKFIVLALLLLLIATGAFAMDRAAGFGALGGMTFQSGEGYLDGDMFRFSGGVCAFFGLGRYTEINLSFLYKDALEYVYPWGRYYDDPLEPSWALQLGLYGKYPFVLSDALVFFPTAGVDFEWSLNMSWWSDLWIRAGIGTDLFFNQTVFLRSHIIYGAAIPITVLEDRGGIKMGHGVLVKVGIGWMF